MNSQLTEVILNQPRATLGHLYLEWSPQPGEYLEVEDQTYMVLERRHRYLLNSGRYQLHKVALTVQKSSLPAERSLLNGNWVIGDITCKYNARSQLLRCSVNPGGPCDRCVHYQPAKNA